MDLWLQQLITVRIHVTRILGQVEGKIKHVTSLSLFASDMSRPLMWPSSEWCKQEYSYNYNVSEETHS